eukprot:1120059-Prymnesium_polylepis.1
MLLARGLRAAAARSHLRAAPIRGTLLRAPGPWLWQQQQRFARAQPEVDRAASRRLKPKKSRAERAKASKPESSAEQQARAQLAELVKRWDASK